MSKCLSFRMIKHYNCLSVPVQSLLILLINWTIVSPLIIVDENFGFCARCLTWVELNGIDFCKTKGLIFFTCILTYRMTGG